MKKLLAWDGDETLWQGTLVEGAAPVLPPGRAKLCRELSERGVLQSLATHNRPDDVQAALYALGLDQYFLFNQAAFEVSKSAMVSAIVSAYDLSRLSDVVFVDDTPFNRAEVKQALPAVTVISPDELPAAVQEHFTKEQYTEEDRLRVRRYQSEQQRQQAAQAYGDDYQAFLRDCKLVMRVHCGWPNDHARVVDLAQRANRMAALARPFTPAELQRLGPWTWTARVQDKFGDYGLSAFVIARPTTPYQTTIEAVVISCRLQGRGIGSALLGHVLNHQPLRTRVMVRWAETEHNAGMRGLFEWYHFQCNGTTQMQAELLITNTVALPGWITIVPE